MDLNRRYKFKEKYNNLYYQLQREIKRLERLKRTVADKMAEHINNLLEGK